MLLFSSFLPRRNENRRHIQCIVCWAIKYNKHRYTYMILNVLPSPSSLSAFIFHLLGSYKCLQISDGLKVSFVFSPTRNTFTGEFHNFCLFSQTPEKLFSAILTSHSTTCKNFCSTFPLEIHKSRHLLELILFRCCSLYMCNSSTYSHKEFLS